MKQLNMPHLPTAQQSWLEATFARNRACYGDLRMEAAAPPPAPAAPAVVPPAVPAAPANPVVPPVVVQPVNTWETNPGAGGKEAVLADLARARREAAEATERANTLQAAKDKAEQEKMSDLEKAQKSAADATARAEKAERAALIAKVALDKKLPSVLASRLTGANQAELEADADALLALIPAGPATLPAPGTPRPDPSQGGGDGSKLSGAARGQARWEEKHGKKPRPS